LSYTVKGTLAQLDDLIQESEPVDRLNMWANVVAFASSKMQVAAGESTREVNALKLRINDMSAKLAGYRPCKHCLEDESLSIEQDDEGNYHVLCHECGMRGPLCTDSLAAVKAWNDLHDD
jgi:hypothetical protein